MIPLRSSLPCHTMRAARQHVDLCIVKHAPWIAAIHDPHTISAVGARCRFLPQARCVPREPAAPPIAVLLLLLLRGDAPPALSILKALELILQHLHDRKGWLSLA